MADTSKPKKKVKAKKPGIKPTKAAPAAAGVLPVVAETQAVTGNGKKDRRKNGRLYRRADARKTDLAHRAGSARERARAGEESLLHLLARVQSYFADLVVEGEMAPGR